MIKEFVKLLDFDSSAIDEGLAYLFHTKAYLGHYITSYIYKEKKGDLSKLKGKERSTIEFFKEWNKARRTNCKDMDNTEIQIACRDICWNSETEEEAIRKIRERIRHTPTVRFEKLDSLGYKIKGGTILSPNDNNTIRF